jgi:type I restriction enzyme M protein
MLDTDTKRRIDTARDILVGKVPDPKSQVEQITIALIYKFMDDMDAESEEFGGKRKFFAREFARYGWAKLMRSGLGGHETLNLYAEAIAKMPENPGIPLLFRDIFKNAYLPYRDPETLRAFLKVIDEFTYDHSERLGDAFEYLLSVLGSQGDAGQFRTPRHIIDFMIEIVDPKKTETILDPACGTAGFLISSYKHILKANTDAKGHSTLTPDEKGRLARNFTGYDISPDMVRLSLVNLYLHGFADPHIAEYDTLTSLDKWTEYADVILANPPFMSPKGGIKPHNRFSVQSKRSEVLFVDYMAEHLRPDGRAGIIVPEGIIFQSQNAYKQLRKMLVEEYLVAVVSLPAGVFNPYSGVKTSILILDKSLKKKTNNILFLKIESEGTDLATRRRLTEKSDLPQVIIEFIKYRKDILTNQPAADPPPTLGLIVSKDRIAADDDYNLNGDRYREDLAHLSYYAPASFGEIFELSGKEKVGNRILPIMSITMKNGLVDQSQKFNKRIASADISLYKVVHENELVVGFPIDEGVLGFLTQYAAAAVSPAYGIWKIRPEKSVSVDVDYLEIVLRSPRAIAAYKSKMQGAVNRRRSVPTHIFVKIQIPLPPLKVQKEIVAEIEGYQKVIDGARAVLDNYRPHVPIRPDWPMVPIRDVCIRITKGSSPKWQGIEYTSEEDGILFITSENVGLGRLLLEKLKYVERRFNDIESKSILQKDDVLTNIVGASIGRTSIFDLDIAANVNQAVCIMRPNTALLSSMYLMTLLNSPDFIQKMHGSSVENARANISMGVLGSLAIPLPPLATQNAIVAEIEAEQALVTVNRELIARFEKKIQATLVRVWGEDEPAPAEA